MASDILITKDFLRGLSNNPGSDPNSKTELASKRHERCSSPNSPLSSSSLSPSNHQKQANPGVDFQDLNLNYPLSSSAAPCLDLKLQSSASPSSSSFHSYQSVCTLDKVKSALQRAEKETTTKKRQSPPLPSSSSGMFAAACPGCLLYVMASKTNPKCPRCNSTVPSPLNGNVKKARTRIDLNA